MATYTDEPALTRDTGEVIEQYRLMRLNSSDAWVYADAGEMPHAVACERIASGLPLAGKLLDNKPGTIKCVASAAISLFDDVYTAADGKVSTVNTGVYVGQALDAASGDDSVIEVLPRLRRCPMVNVAASGVEGASSTTEDVFDKSFTVPASELKAGTIIRVRCSGIILDNNSTDTFTIRLKAGTETIVATAALDAADDDQWAILADIVIRTIGATGTLVAFSAHAFDAAGDALGVNNKASAVEDMTGGLAITATVQASVSHADNQARLEVLEVEVLTP